MIDFFFLFETVDIVNRNQSEIKWNSDFGSREHSNSGGIFVSAECIFMK